MDEINPAYYKPGKRIDADGNEVAVTDEAEHFYVCAQCGQAVDMRDLSDVFYHEVTGHNRKPIDA